MKIFRLISLVVLSLVDIYLIYATIGYIAVGLSDYPQIVGVDTSNTTFFGMYFMAITFGVLAIIATIFIIIISVKLYRTKHPKIKK